RRHHPPHRRLHPGQTEHAGPVGRRQILEPVRADLRRMGRTLPRDLPAHTQAETYQLPGAFNGAIPTNGRTSQFYYTQNVAGAELQMNTDTLLWGARNIFTYGLSFAYTTTTRPRDRWAITLATGARTQVVAGETFPNKNFPDTDTVQAGV